MKTLYYVVEYNTQPGEGHYDELTGTKDITGYTISNDVPKVLCILTEYNHTEAEEALLNYLNEFDYDTDQFKFQRL